MMALSYLEDVEEEEEEEYEALGEEFDEDMDALKRACELTGENHGDFQKLKEADFDHEKEKEKEEEEEEEEDGDDNQFLQNIQNRLMLGSAQIRIPSLIKSEIEEKPLEVDAEEDDADILRAIRNRFEGAGSLLDQQTSITCGTYDEETETSRTTPLEYENRASISTKHEVCNNDLENRVLDQVSIADNAACRAIIVSPYLQNPDDMTTGKSSNGYIDAVVAEPLSTDVSQMPKYAGIPGYARALIEALKKNRLCQKTLRSKLIQIETKIEENKELRNRVKCLVDFQNACKRLLRQMLTQDTDSTLKLISCSKARLSSSKVKETADSNVAYRYCGPPENEDVVKYKMVQKSFPTIVDNKRWSKKDTENLANGVKQQMQETLVRQAMEHSSSHASFLDEQISAISLTEVSEEDIRSFLPHVEWERLASTYVQGHSGADCEARWLNNEDPLINHSPWTKVEDKKLLMIVQKNGLHNWVQISNMLGTNRTPSQCLSRYQRSLNAHIMRKDWIAEEDEQLRALIETYGENDWQFIAANMEGRTGAQCLNRWCKSILPDRKKVGRWTVEEDKRLKVAVMIYGPRMWKKIAALVPGRTEVQCRERWRNVLDPSLKLDEWTKEEDGKLETAVSRYGYSWSKVATFVALRTDNQCWRRWKVLHPQELAAAQKARKMQKAALISNFVGRKKERPTIGPNDFLLEHEEGSEANRQEEHRAPVKKRGRRPRKKDSNIEPGAKKRKKTRHTAEREDLQQCSKGLGSQNNPEHDEHHCEGMTTATEGRELHSCPKTNMRLKRKREKLAPQKENVSLEVDDGGSAELQTLSPLASSDALQLAVDASGQTEELPLLKNDTFGQNSMQCNSSSKTVTGKQTKLRRKTMSVNQKTGVPDLMQDVSATHVGNAEANVSSAKSGKNVKIKQTKSCRKRKVSSKERERHEIMQLATPSVHDDSGLQLVCATTNNYHSGTVLDKNGQGDSVSMINSDQGWEIPFDSIKSNQRAKEDQAKSVKKGSEKITHVNGVQTKSASRGSNAKQKKHEQGTLQVMMPTAIEKGNLISSDHGVETSLEWTKSSRKVRQKQSKPVKKGSDKVIHESEKQTESANGESSLKQEDDLGTLHDVAPAATEQGNLDGMPLGVDGAKLSSCSVSPDKRMMVNQTRSTLKSIQTGQAEDDRGKNQLVMQCAGDISDMSNGESEIGQDESVTMAAKTISSWPLSLGLQDASRDKLNETMDHVHIYGQREDNTNKHVGDNLQSNDMVSINQQKHIQTLENGQNKSQKLLLSNESINPKNDRVSQAFADTEITIKGNINERTEQVDDLQQRRSRRATRLDLNYKELLKGNICFHMHRN